ncbi:hypothetical protein GQ43DRAFT_476125 [Delitschia confertaspora ATCC 74209]|uniref:Uncharacterized protein n=1 Tax=Delitschia confertaspora ATCC 74209 TaxID=1513339 RepID=A0A9P4MU16_9PLEO|nr:hypothetical protein GQ43DRAFT_476125 [Delitschia confertaspora ATCC 74209]
MALEFLFSRFGEIHDQFYDLLELSDFSIPTWLALGAGLQQLSTSYLPLHWSLYLPILWLGFRFSKAIFDTLRLPNASFADIKPGKWTTPFPELDNSSKTSTSNGVVVFLLGARLNHPFGKLAPGVVDLDVVFKDMWREAEKNRKKWSYLGRTSTLCDTSDTEGTTTVWVSYWKDLKGLQAFSASAAHRLGQNGWETGKYPHVGIMHETYHAPKGSWETIYGNFPAWGLGNSKYIVEDEMGGIQLGDTLVPNPKGSSMFSRMRWAKQNSGE